MHQQEPQIHTLYRTLIQSWNTRNAASMAACFAPQGKSIGFDGSQMTGPAEIEKTLEAIFKHHPTPPYVTIVREVKMLSGEVAILQAVVGMVPPGKQEINPALNAIQTMIAVKQGEEWKIELFQNTPAAFHGRPEEAEKLTNELRAVLGARG